MALSLTMLSIIAGSLLSIIFIFFVVSNAVPEWSKIVYDVEEATTGLWLVCSKVRDRKICGSIECPTKEMNDESIWDGILTARVFVTMACIIEGISVWCLSLYAVAGDGTKNKFLVGTKCLGIACLVAGILGVAVGIDITNDTDPTDFT